ncbi:Peptidoglycan-associated lipoprotein [Dyadobacter sp. CECT 9275]|uniref:Peptidoglycan-associated lipoprotein n=1 Tax=Dyadobacter helix TaxID=2822344 RepID=A0A916JHC4_9BACT|nr:OmpA family protein [Dyadobacter sp. CECT 9275]CAG5012261.1 Peptidoglycan-associated lipoprotein [Dyadobacter sp. CECT 9275]
MIKHLYHIIFGVLSLYAFVAQGQGRIGTQRSSTNTGLGPNRELSPYSVSVRGGLTQFFGEMSNQDMKGMIGVSLGRAYTKRFSMNLDYTAGKLGGQKVDFFNSYFVSEYNTLELLAKWNLTEQFSRYEPGKFNISVYGGLGMMFFSSNAYDLTTDKLVRFSNSEVSGRNPLFLRWGNPRGKLGVKKTQERVIPLGTSLDYRLSPQWKVGLDYRFYLVRSDKLDATSGRRLVNPEEGNSYSDTPNDKFSFLSISLTYRFTRATRDTDKDGIPDDRDRCPDVAGIARYFGCPDTDGDGIPDYVDRCPNEAGSAKTRGCPDSDGDGFVDRLDNCPNIAGTIQGCPDSDGDGVLDELDACPDVKGEARFAGCPDSDGDGISDKLDRCPDQPGTYANKGCPDRDGDGVNDAEDRCIDVPGDQSNFGCPLVSPVQRQDLQAQIDQLLASPVRFATGTDVIEEGSYQKLTDIAMLLIRNPNTDISIEGHTDDIGDEKANQILSERRAEAVKTYLRERGISSARMLTVGYGESRPVDASKTAAARFRNRRVMIRVEEQ